MYTFDEIAIKYNWEKRDNPRESIQRFESYARSHGVYLQWIVGTSKPRKYEILNNPEECFTQTQLIEKYGLENKSYPNFISFMAKRGILLERQDFCQRPYFYKILNDNSFNQNKWFETSDPTIEATKTGLVRNKKSKHIYNITSPQGYKQYRGEDGKLHFVHRLIMETFCPIDNIDCYYVDHINGKRDDNTLENLRWVSQQENMIYKYENWSLLKDNFDILLQTYGYEQLNEIFEKIINIGATKFLKI